MQNKINKIDSYSITFMLLANNETPRRKQRGIDPAEAGQALKTASGGLKNIRSIKMIFFSLSN